MLKSYGDDTRELLRKLLAPIPTSADGLQLRAAIVRHNTESTYVVPGDWPRRAGTEWFLDAATPEHGSDAHYLVDGPDTFEAMAEAMKTADDASHFIVLLGWSLDVHTRLTAAQSFLNIVEERTKLGVRVRVLLWDNTAQKTIVDEDNKPLKGGEPPRRLNKNAQLSLEKLGTSLNSDISCNLDDETRGWISGTVAGISGNSGVHSYGAHHQKILLVYGREGLIGFCGGLDIDPSRNASMHDVHVRVRGFAAERLWEIVKERWEQSRDDDKLPTPPTISDLAPKAYSAPPQTPYLVSVVQTVGNPSIAKSTPNTLWPTVREAVRRAKTYIYVEDQFFWSFNLIDELIESAKRVRFIVVVVPQAGKGVYPYKRHEALAALQKRGGSGIEKKIGVFQLPRRAEKGSSPATTPHDYLHAKLLIVDDELAMIQSANANNRGYFFDSEVGACVAERAADDAAGSRGGEWSVIVGNFARRLRMRLWSEHLGLDTEEVFDAVGAHVHWLKWSHAAQIGSYMAENLRKRAALQVAEKLDWKLLPFPWDPDRDVLPWWMAPLEEWQSPRPPEDAIVDPVPPVGLF